MHFEKQGTVGSWKIEYRSILREGTAWPKNVSQVMRELEVFKRCVCHCGVSWTVVREVGICRRQSAGKSPLGVIPKAKKAHGSLERPHKVNMLHLLVLIFAEAFGLQGP